MNLSYCKFCKKDTVSVEKETLSASENRHFTEFCTVCGLRKTTIEDLMKKIKKRKR